MSGGILERGDIVRGDIVLGGYCPGGYCPGDIVRGDIVRGDIVLEPHCTYSARRAGNNLSISNRFQLILTFPKLSIKGCCELQRVGSYIKHNI